MIGQLRHRLGLYIPSTTPDNAGGHSTNWMYYNECWADIQPRSGQESGDNGRLSVTQTYRVVIRFQEDFPERVRVIWGDKILRMITASDPDTRRERLHLICEEEVQ